MADPKYRVLRKEFEPTCRRGQDNRDMGGLRSHFKQVQRYDRNEQTGCSPQKFSHAHLGVRKYS